MLYMYMHNINRKCGLIETDTVGLLTYEIYTKKIGFLINISIEFRNILYRT